jgi:methyl-accepting chemotaxis protein
MDVVVKLEPLSEQSKLSKFLRNEDYAGLLNGFVQDIATLSRIIRFVAENARPMLLITVQTSLQQSTYENTRDIHEVTRGVHEVTRDIHEVARGTSQTTKGIAESTADIVHKTKEIIVSAFEGIEIV